MTAREPLASRAFLLAAASHFLHALAFYLYVSVSGFLAGLGASEPEIGAIFAVTAVTAIALRPLLGKIMDDRGRRIVAVTGGAMSTLVCAAYLTVTTLGPWIVAIRVVHGVSEAMLFASLFAIAADQVPASRRIEGIAWFGVTGLMPMAMSGLVADFLLAHGSYRTLFATSVGLSVLGFLASLPIRDPARAPDAEPSRGVMAALVQHDLRPLWVIGLVFAAALSGPFTFIKTFVLSTGIGSVGAFIGAYGAAAALVRMGFASLPERVGPKRVLLPALAFQLVGTLTLAFATSTTAVVAAGFLCGIGHGFTFPILLGLVVTRAREQERGAALSIFTALFDGGTAIGAPTLGWIVKAHGYTAAFATAAVMVGVGAGAFTAWDRGR